MKINYILENEDIVNFNLYQFKKSSKFYTTLLFQSILPMAIMVFAVTRLKPNLFSNSSSYLMLIPLFLIWVFLFKYIFEFTLKRKILRLLKMQKNVEIGLEKNMTFSENSLIEGSGQELNYKDILMIKDVNNYIYIYKDSEQAYILPKKYLSEENIQYILNLKK